MPTPSSPSPTIRARPASAPRRAPITPLPAQRNHHWTKSLAAGPDGRLYVGVGSNSNVAEHGMDEEEERAAIWAIDPADGSHTIFASGLRNPVGLAFLPGTDDLYAVVNERDELGSDLVPDYLTRVQPGAFYGWPWSYYGRPCRHPPAPAAARHGRARHRARLRARAPCRRARPDLLRRRSGSARSFASGAFIGEHGSWNRRPRSGYKVVFVPFDDGRPAGQPIDVLTGFLDDRGRARGRPVGVQIARDGALLVADDVGNTVWRVSAAR